MLISFRVLILLAASELQISLNLSSGRAGERERVGKGDGIDILCLYWRFFPCLLFTTSIRIQMELDINLDPDPHYNVCGPETLLNLQIPVLFQ